MVHSKSWLFITRKKDHKCDPNQGFAYIILSYCHYCLSKQLPPSLYVCANLSRISVSIVDSFSILWFLFDFPLIRLKRKINYDEKNKIFRVISYIHKHTHQIFVIGSILRICNWLVVALDIKKYIYLFLHIPLLKMIAPHDQIMSEGHESTRGIQASLYLKDKKT